MGIEFPNSDSFRLRLIQRRIGIEGGIARIMMNFSVWFVT
ncbi:uncharacterized protein G2W53_030505 [Senna tora]|uniref:Uncharacterized protein n=1 Tax=Senna tora TaxID=362788 RepID=A0A834T7J8_9FABA|nr:uncharacterized protein G2W53_030505 [Senna tora]